MTISLQSITVYSLLPFMFFRVLRAQMEKMANPDSLAPLAPLVPLDLEE